MLLVLPDIHQEKIVEEGGLHALLMLLQSSRNATVLRVASGAIANLAMNGSSSPSHIFILTLRLLLNMLLIESFFTPPF